MGTESDEFTVSFEKTDEGFEVYINGERQVSQVPWRCHSRQADFDFPDRSAEAVDHVGFDCRADSIKEQELLHDRMLTEKSPFERMMEVGEQYLPRRVLWGLLPEALLEDYNFYQENAPPHRVIRGYPAKGRWPSEHEEEELLDSDASNKKAGASF